MTGERLLVPVSDSGGFRQTVEYAVSRALADGSGTVRFVFVHPSGVSGDQLQPAAEGESRIDQAQQLLERAAVWAEEDAGDHTDELTVETSQVGMEEYLFGPEDVAGALAEEASSHDISRIVLDPEYDPGIGAPLVRPLESELSRLDLVVEEADISRQTRRTPLLLRSSAVQTGSLFLISFLFYMILAADPFYWFEWVTGAVSATIVSIGLSRITFTRDPGGRTLLRVLRHSIYVPYLIWEIIKANVVVAAVILHPRMPIEPRMTRIRPSVWGGLPITSLANSITLTPGTLTVRVQDDKLVVHTLVTAAREDLFDGGLERGVRFVFYGRKAMNIPSPLERGDTEILQQPADQQSETERTEIPDGETDDEPPGETGETPEDSTEDNR